MTNKGGWMHGLAAWQTDVYFQHKHVVPQGKTPLRNSAWFTGGRFRNALANKFNRSRDVCLCDSCSAKRLWWILALESAMLEQINLSWTRPNKTTPHFMGQRRFVWRLPFWPLFLRTEAIFVLFRVCGGGGVAADEKCVDNAGAELILVLKDKR
jgi:hypothetical protein